MTEIIEQLQFLTPKQVMAIARKWGTPVFVYSEERLRKQATHALALDLSYGLTVRYAMKANPNRRILQLFKSMGIQIDASSGFEAQRAIRAGIRPEHILVTTQQFPDNFAELASQGVQFNATSLHQLEIWGKRFPGSSVGIRLNPGIGSGHSAKTNVGGPSASFGIWHAYIPEIQALADTYDLHVMRLHTHIGAGTDPIIWQHAMRLSLERIMQFPEATIMNLGGGFKVGRMHGEATTDLVEVGRHVREALESFADKTDRKLQLEIEPGTYLTATTGSLLTTVQDIADTGADGYQFLKLDAGMTELLRPALYGAQHPLVIVGDQADQVPYVVAGHCCESGDVLTTLSGDPDGLQPRLLQRAQIGDRLVVEGVGAYCAAMSAIGYNSFPQAKELLLKTDGSVVEIRRQGTLEELIAAEY